jgi:uncharacterized membrane protein YfcA
MTDAGFLVSALAVLAGALIQATGGIGFAMFAAPIVAIVRPDLVPGPMIVAGCAVSLLIAMREFHKIDFTGAAFAIGGRIPGALVAGLIIGLAPRSAFAVSFAVLILLAVLLSVSGWRVRAHSRIARGARVGGAVRLARDAARRGAHRARGRGLRDIEWAGAPRERARHAWHGAGHLGGVGDHPARADASLRISPR